MPEFHLRQLRFIYRACGKFIVLRERIQTFRETRHLKHIYKKKLDKACFAYDAACSDSKDLAKRTVQRNILKFKAYETTISPK